MQVQDLFISGQEGYHTYRIPALAVAPDGAVLAFCEARRHTGRDDDQIDILLRRSTDGGRTWEPRQRIIADGERTCGNPCPVVDHDRGAVLLPFLQGQPGGLCQPQHGRRADLDRSRGDYRPGEGFFVDLSWYRTWPRHSTAKRSLARALLGR